MPNPPRFCRCWPPFHLFSAQPWQYGPANCPEPVKIHNGYDPLSTRKYYLVPPSNLVRGLNKPSWPGPSSPKEWVGAFPHPLDVMGRGRRRIGRKCGRTPRVPSHPLRRPPSLRQSGSGSGCPPLPAPSGPPPPSPPPPRDRPGTPGSVVRGWKAWMSRKVSHIFLEESDKQCPVLYARFHSFEGNDLNNFLSQN